ncbi:DUF4062 domain-containing protein [Bacillus swezeyi]|uniref:DUF4062 domain-containing protein n=1 Tax=Bacillus swezeyi TaxID=1925020 RepID=UPI001680E668|nr:DUF4062 domain-containing protein [Bacillus swezeyi]
MINRTRIFISSAYEDALKGPRQTIKRNLEKSGHEVPIFENGDFGTWEKDTLQQCLDVVDSSDVFILLINEKAGNMNPETKLTPTYLEYRAALMKKKHILVFVSSYIKQQFDLLRREFDQLKKAYLRDNPRQPSSPIEPFEKWMNEQSKKDGMMKEILNKADHFIWAFLYDLFENRSWLYTIDFHKTEEECLKISSMLSTSFRSVVGYLSRQREIQQLEKQATYLANYTDFTINLMNVMNENNLITHTKDYDGWCRFLEKGISCFTEKEIIQTPGYNPICVNTISNCFAASLYRRERNLLSLVGTAGEITANEFYSLDEEDVYVVNAYNETARLIFFSEEKQTVYLTERFGEYVLCLHFRLSEKWSTEQVQAYSDEVECAIIDEHEHFYVFLTLLLGGREHE